MRPTVFSRVVIRGVLSAALAVAVAGCGGRDEAEEASVPDLIQQAWTSYRLNEFHDAILAFEAARAAAEEGSDDWAMATYGLGIAWDLRRPGEDPAKATRLFREVMEKAPGSPMAPWTELALVRQKHLVPVGQEPDYAAVKAGFQHIIDAYPGHLAAKEAFLYLEGIRLSEGINEPEKLEALSREAESNLLAYIEGQEAAGNAEFVSPAWSLLTVAYVNLDEQEERLQAEEESFGHVETDPNDPSVEYAWAYWNIATIAEFEVGDFETARMNYRKLIEEYPNDIRVHGCKTALKRMNELEARIREEIAAEKGPPAPGGKKKKKGASAPDGQPQPATQGE